MAIFLFRSRRISIQNLRFIHKTAYNTISTRSKEKNPSSKLVLTPQMFPEVAKRIKTVEDAYNHASSIFESSDLSYGHSTVDFDDEAAFLVLHSLNLPIDSLEKSATKLLTPSEAFRMLELIYQRIHTRKPLAYILKAVYQQGELFYIDERALIPRSFIGDILFNKYGSGSGSCSVQDFLDTNSVKRVLDLCTGSGCLAVLSARAFRNVDVIHATDISAPALEVAAINIASKQLNHLIHLRQGDLFEAVTNSADENGSHFQVLEKSVYDLIVCNPPYVNSSRMKRLPPEYLLEPAVALDGGGNGLKIIHRILINASAYLRNDGYLLVEVGHARRSLFKLCPMFCNCVRWLSTSGMSIGGAENLDSTARAEVLLASLNDLILAEHEFQKLKQFCTQ